MQRPSQPRLTARFATAVVACAAALLVSVAPGASAAPPTPYDHVLTVGFAPSASAASRVAVRRDVGVQARNALPAPGLQQVTVPNGQSLSATAASLRAFNNVDFVEMPGSY